MISPGSQWHRWEPHIHAPGTVLNDRFGGGDPWDVYLTKIEIKTPLIRALAVTDYYLTDLYEQVLQHKEDGRLPHVDLIFPNIESVRRLYVGLQSFRSMSRMDASLMKGERVAVEVLPVLGQSAAAVEPGDGAFDHPTPGLDDEALHPIGSLDDLGLEIGQDAGQGAVKDRALIGAVGEQFPEKGKQTKQGRQQRETAVAILNVGGGDDAVQQQALRIDQNMPLLALDQLAGIEAVAVDASPLFQRFSHSDCR